MPNTLVYENPLQSLDDWAVESNGVVRMGGGAFRWDCGAATRMGTVWCRRRFEGPFMVEYDVESEAGADNINLIFCADTPDGRLLETSSARTGIYTEYHSFPNYICTYLTDETKRTRVRFRKNPGFALLSEAYADLPIRQGVRMTLQVSVDAGGVIVLRRDGQDVHRHTVAAPLPLAGYVGLRTWNTVLVYRSFRVFALSTGAA